ncbi:sulfatase-like hydrolase/transferase [Actinobacillus delphinicola]|uniref:sulfatase-like hydrolase/transferase n=1 Tax=Actinobacillus delphinicola TaxID=51161 RepID=UPI002442DB15|nr:sulfatase-like hydrolase/transferase [Actinobacillus delphinicola]
MNMRYQRTVYIRIILVILYSIFTVYALGLNYDLFRNRNITSMITLILSIFILRRLSYPIFCIYFVFNTLLAVLLLPTSFVYREISSDMIIAGFSTNIAEATEYILNLPVTAFLLDTIYVILSILTFLICKKNIIKNNKLMYGICSIFIILVLFSPIKHYLKGKYDMPLELITYINPPIVKVFTKYYYVHHNYEKTLQLIKNKKNENTWVLDKENNLDSTSIHKYHTYVVVIGESNRRDYMSVYSYPIDDTPFLDKVNGVFFKNYISAQSHTVASLKAMFIKNNIIHYDYTKNVINLANSAGYKTYWISNQGFIGVFDTPTTLIATNANKTYFLNKGDYTSDLHSDVIVENTLNTILKESPNSDKVIFIHIMGSHPRFCRRLSPDFHIKDYHNILNPNMDCYLSSIKQTDKLLSDIYTMLENTHQSFSMMYFSDHGLSHTSLDVSKTSLVHGDLHKSNFNVPMIVLSSDSKKRTFINAYKSGFNFVNQFAQWVGIKAEGLSDTPKFFSEESPKNIYVLDKNHLYKNLKDDPAFLPVNK